MPAAITLARLAGLRLPETSPHRREPAVAPRWRDAAYLAGYDDRTLYYDAVAIEGGRVLITAPRFGRLWPLLRGGLRRDGRRLPWLFRRSSGRCQQVLLRCRPGAELTLTLDGETRPLVPREGLAARFAGLNAAATMNRDNDPEWIADWARWHAARHGLQGVAIFDNGSTRYTPRALAERLARVPGLVQVAVISAPFPYGTSIHADGRLIRLKFLQTAMLNLARRDMFARARAVLNADIDELVHPLNSQSVFDAAFKARFGALRLGGEWTFPEAGALLPVAQSGHLWRAVPPRPCASKWCARPWGPLSRLGWNVHNVGQNWGRRLAADPRFAIAHCSGTTTAWKPDSRRFSPPGDLRRDGELERQYARHLQADGAASREGA